MSNSYVPANCLSNPPVGCSFDPSKGGTTDWVGQGVGVAKGPKTRATVEFNLPGTEFTISENLGVGTEASGMVTSISISGFSDETANGVYTVEAGSTVNGEPTYTNGDGWYMFWDGDNWVITDTPYNKTGKFIIGGPNITDEFSGGADDQSGFTGQTGDSEVSTLDVSGFTPPQDVANGTYYLDGNTKNGKPTYTNGNGWFMFWDGTQWVITDVPYNTDDNKELSITGFTSPQEDANGDYVIDGNSKNGRPTYSNGNGWYMFWNGERWVITDTPYVTEESIVTVTNFTPPVSEANGEYVETGEYINGKPTFYNGNGFYMYWGGSSWIITDTPYEKKGKWTSNGTSLGGTFNGTGGKSTDFNNQTGSSDEEKESVVKTIDISGFTPDKEVANGTYQIDGNTKNGKPTYSNGAGWYMFWDGTKWVITDTPYEVSGYKTTGVSGFTTPLDSVNGTYTVDGNTKNGKPTYSNGKGWYKYWDGTKWVISDVAYSKKAPARWTSNGSELGGTFDGTNGESSEFNSQTGGSTKGLTSEWIGNGSKVGGTFGGSGGGSSTGFGGKTGSSTKGTTNNWTSNGTSQEGEFGGEGGSSDSLKGKSGTSTKKKGGEWVADGDDLGGTFGGGGKGSSTGFGGKQGGSTLTKITIQSFVSPNENANGEYTPDGNSQNGKPTYSNGNGWYLYWDGSNWVVTDTAYNKNGNYTIGGSSLNDSFTGKNQSGFDGETGTPGDVTHGEPETDLGQFSSRSSSSSVSSISSSLSSSKSSISSSSKSSSSSSVSSSSVSSSSVSSSSVSSSSTSSDSSSKSSQSSSRSNSSTSSSKSSSSVSSSSESSSSVSSSSSSVSSSSVSSSSVSSSSVSSSSVSSSSVSSSSVSSVSSSSSSSAVSSSRSSSSSIGLVELSFDSVECTKAISMSYTAMAVTSDGSLWTWGNNDQGEMGMGNFFGNMEKNPFNVSANSSVLGYGVKLIEHRYSHSVLLKTDGSVWTAGDNDYGELGDGTTTQNKTWAQIISSGVVDIGAGERWSAAVKSDGSLWTWGRNNSNQLGDGTTVDKSTPQQIISSGVVRVDCGDHHGLALKDDGSLWSWGKNNYGQTGDGNATASGGTNVASPVKIVNSSVVDFSAGDDHSLYVRSSGTIYGWGYNSSGQLGLGPNAWPNDRKNAPSQLPYFGNAGRNFAVRVSAGEDHSLAITSDGTLWGWGANINGELCNGAAAEDDASGYPIDVLYPEISMIGGVAMARAANRCSMIVKTDGSLHTVGQNINGQLGTGSHGSSAYKHSLYQVFSPQSLAVCELRDNESSASSRTSVKQTKLLAAGLYHSGYIATAGVNNDGHWGDAYMCGHNLYGTLGDSNTSAKTSFTQVSNGEQTLKLASGFYHTLRLQVNGRVTATGRNTYGSIGDGTQVNVNTFTDMFDRRADVCVDIAACQDHSFAVKNDGTLWGWGRNNSGQLGDGTQVDKLTPVQIDTDVLQCSTGWNHSHYIKFDGSLWGMGWNIYGQVGDNTQTSPRTSPVACYGMGSGVTQVVDGAQFSMAIKDGDCYVWGSDANDALGNLTGNSRIFPSIILNDVSFIAAGHSTAMAVKTDGSLWAWGWNGNGQYGNGSTTNATAPTQVVASGVVQVEIHTQHSIMLKDDGSIWTTGTNAQGQLGNGTTSSSATTSWTQIKPAGTVDLW